VEEEDVRRRWDKERRFLDIHDAAAVAEAIIRGAILLSISRVTL
jgi:hypothetical protein